MKTASARPAKARRRNGPAIAGNPIWWFCRIRKSLKVTTAMAVGGTALSFLMEWLPELDSNQ